MQAGDPEAQKSEVDLHDPGWRAAGTAGMLPATWAFECCQQLPALREGHSGCGDAARCAPSLQASETTVPPLQVVLTVAAGVPSNCWTSGKAQAYVDAWEGAASACCRLAQVQPEAHGVELPAQQACSWILQRT